MGMCSACLAAAPRCPATSGTSAGYRCDRLAGHVATHCAITSRRTSMNGRETGATSAVWR